MRVSDEIQSIGSWSNNSEMIADVAVLGFIPEPVLDMTYGAGGFWKKWQPEHLVMNDIDPTRGTDHHDFRHTPWRSRAFATVVLDPPYKLQGTPKSGEMDTRYGTDEVRSRSDLLSLLVSGMAEAARLADKFMLVKVMDQVNGGQVRWLTTVAIDTARALEFRHVDSFILQGGRPQPEGRAQKHARHEFSTLLVFRRRR